MDPDNRVGGGGWGVLCYQTHTRVACQLSYSITLVPSLLLKQRQELNVLNISFSATQQDAKAPLHTHTLPSSSCFVTFINSDGERERCAVYKVSLADQPASHTFPQRDLNRDELFILVCLSLKWEQQLAVIFDDSLHCSQGMRVWWSSGASGGHMQLLLRELSANFTCALKLLAPWCFQTWWKKKSIIQEQTNGLMIHLQDPWKPGENLKECFLSLWCVERSRCETLYSNTNAHAWTSRCCSVWVCQMAEDL